jgi:molybdate transport system substrate-binding protein
MTNILTSRSQRRASRRIASSGYFMRDLASNALLPGGARSGPAMRRWPAVLALCLAAMATPAFADYPVAPDVVVFCEPTLRPFVTALGAHFRDETGIPVRVFAAPTWANLAEIARRTRDDVIIGEGEAAAARAAEQHLIKSDTVVRLWRNRLVAAALADDFREARAASPPRPLDLASVAGKETIAIVDPAVASAGQASERGLRALGLWEAVAAKSIGVVDTADAAFLLSAGKARLVVVYASDASAEPGLAVTDALPADDVAPTIYWAAQTERALSPNSAKFVAFLGRAEVRGWVRDAGLEVLP